MNLVEYLKIMFFGNMLIFYNGFCWFLTSKNHLKIMVLEVFEKAQFCLFYNGFCVSRICFKTMLFGDNMFSEPPTLPLPHTQILSWLQPALAIFR